MNILFTFLFTILFTLSPCITGMNHEDYSLFLTPENGIQKRFPIAKKYAQLGINEMTAGRDSIVTDYLKNFPYEDIRIDNEFIPYFFQQGLNFVGGRMFVTCFDDKNKIIEGVGKLRYIIKLFNYLTWCKTKEKIEEKCFLTKLCLYKKLEATDLLSIKKDITFLNLIFKNKITPTTQLPKCVYNILISKHLINKYCSLQGIVSALEDYWYKSGYKPRANRGLLRWLNEHKLDPNHYKLSLALLELEQWENNNIYLTKELIEFNHNEESIFKPLKEWQAIIHERPDVDPLVNDTKNSYVIVSAFDHDHVTSCNTAYKLNPEYQKIEQEYALKNREEKYKTEQALSTLLACDVKFCDSFDIQKKNIGRLARTLIEKSSALKTHSQKSSIIVYDDGVCVDEEVDN